MTLWQEFKKFAVKGNVVDLAVGVIIGAAFGKIVTSLVEDIVMPPIALLLGKVDFANRFVALGPGEYATFAEAKKAAVPTIHYGHFLQVVAHFLIVAWIVFLVVKVVNRAREKPPEAQPNPTTKSCGECLSEIPKEARRCRYCTSAQPSP